VFPLDKEPVRKETNYEIPLKSHDPALDEEFLRRFEQERLEYEQMERELEMKENDRNYGNITDETSFKKKVKKGKGTGKAKRKQWDQVQEHHPIQIMQYEQPDKWITINELLAKANLQLIDL
jgi:hypothetical protein